MRVQGGLLPQLVLIAVHDRATRHSYKQFLVPRGFVVEEAADAEEALAKAISDPPDIIIVERELPTFGVDQLCGILKEDRDTRHVPIVLLTNEAVIIDTTAHGSAADSVLTKPCPPETLLVEMKRVGDRSADLRARAKAARSAARRLVGQSSDVVQTARQLAGGRREPQESRGGRSVTGLATSR
jgi:DNA-binding response OmpR family regulator